MATAEELLLIAQAEVGYSRWTDPQAGTKYGRWYEANIDRCDTNYNFGASGVPYCAMFVSWCLAQAGVSCAGFPGAYCPSIHQKEHLSAAQLRRGDVVLFDWENDGTDDHVGFVLENTGSSIRTIEGNTNNGAVAIRVRPYSTICGGIRPDYSGAESASSQTQSAPQQAQQQAQSTQGGEKVFYFGHVQKGKTGEPVKMLQSALNIRAGAGLAIDGSCGNATDAAIRAWQRSHGLVVDGSCGPATWTSLLSS